jgi:hypothetical protein
MTGGMFRAPAFCVEALEEALARHGNPQIFNTDQGSQFTCHSFTDVLVEHQIAISMDGRGSWRDNVFECISGHADIGADVDVSASQGRSEIALKEAICGTGIRANPCQGQLKQALQILSHSGDHTEGGEIALRISTPALASLLASHLDKFSQAVHILIPQRQFDIVAESQRMRSEYVSGRLPDPVEDPGRI